jgi:hypothetical protein
MTGSKRTLTAAAIPWGMRAVGRIRSWLAVRHSLPAEMLMVVGLYALYQSIRGVVAGRRDIALRHAEDVVSIERSLHVFVEGGVERTAERMSGLTSALGVLYLSLHLVLTGSLLLWLHQRRPHAYPFFRTTLLVTSAIGLIGYLTFPTAPPRLSSDLLNSGIDRLPVNINSGLLSELYNPYAAVPSMHAAYALVVSAALLLHGRHWIVRVAGFAYPLFVVFIVVATGNHFLFDVGVGAFVDMLAAATAILLLRGTPGQSIGASAASLVPLANR